MMMSDKSDDKPKPWPHGPHDDPPAPTPGSDDKPPPTPPSHP